MTKRIGHKWSGKVLASLYLWTYISSWVTMVVYRGNCSNFCFKGVFWPKAENWGKCLILFVTVLFIGENGYVNLRYLT